MSLGKDRYYQAEGGYEDKPSQAGMHGTYAYTRADLA